MISIRLSLLKQEGKVRSRVTRLLQGPESELVALDLLEPGKTFMKKRTCQTAEGNLHSEESTLIYLFWGWPSRPRVGPGVTNGFRLDPGDEQVGEPVGGQPATRWARR